MVKVPYYNYSASDTFFIYFDFSRDFLFDVPITFIMDTANGALNDHHFPNLADFYWVLISAGAVIPCSADDYAHVEGLLRSWGCFC